MNYKHITLSGVSHKSHIVAVNPFRKMLAEHEWQDFDKANPPIIWYGTAFEGTISEEEIEKTFKLELSNGAIEDGHLADLDKSIKYWESQRIGYKLVYEARPKEVEQPVQQEDVYYCVKPSDIPCHKQCDSCKSVDSRFSVQPSTPIVEQEDIECSACLGFGFKRIKCKHCESTGLSTPIVEEQNQMPFESYPELTDYIQEMACTGKAPRSWTAFIECLNNSLSNREEGRELQEALRLIKSWHESSLASAENFDNQELVSAAVSSSAMAYAYKSCYELISKLSPSSTPLEQKELSQIANDDAIEVIRLHEVNIPDNIQFRTKKGDSPFSPEVWRQVYYLEDGREIILANFSDGINGVNVCRGNQYWRCHVAAYRYLSQKGYKL